MVLGWCGAALRGPWIVQVAALESTATVVRALAPTNAATLPWTDVLVPAWAATLDGARYPSVRAAVLRVYAVAVARPAAVPPEVIEAARTACAAVSGDAAGDLVDAALALRRQLGP
jgi:2-methylisocitrate lyase-like PEP mutase family enzyme